MFGQTPLLLQSKHKERRKPIVSGCALNCACVVKLSSLIVNLPHPTKSCVLLLLGNSNVFTTIRVVSQDTFHISNFTCDNNLEWFPYEVKWFTDLITAEVNMHSSIRLFEVTVLQWDLGNKATPIIESKQCAHVPLKLGNDQVVLRGVHFTFIINIPAVIIAAALFTTRK